MDGDDIEGTREWLEAELRRRCPEAFRAATYAGWLTGFLEGDIMPDGSLVTPQVLTENAQGRTPARWISGQAYVVCQVPEPGGEWYRCIPTGWPWRIPHPQALLITSPAVFGDDEPSPPVASWVPGLDGIGSILRTPEDRPARWLLTEGYFYEIRADQEQPPWHKGRWAVNELPLTLAPDHPHSP
jgi:hypothetical protein